MPTVDGTRVPLPPYMLRHGRGRPGGRPDDDLIVVMMMFRHGTPGYMHAFSRTPDLLLLHLFA